MFNIYEERLEGRLVLSLMGIFQNVMCGQWHMDGFRIKYKTRMCMNVPESSLNFTPAEHIWK